MIFKLIRIRQWSKNLIICVVMFASNEISQQNIITLIILFFGFSLIVSSSYIFNDIVDIDSDINHPTKKMRPIASGKISENNAKFVMVFLLIIGHAIIFNLNGQLLIFTTIYLAFTFLYTTKLKYIKYADLINITSLFLVRLILGGVALNIDISIFLYFFVFLSSLGIVSAKKYSILKSNHILDSNSKVKNFLNTNYKDTELKNIMDWSFLLSCITYLIWIFIEKINAINFYGIFILLFSLFSYIFFIYYFRKDTIQAKTEEIVEVIFTNKNILFSLLFFGLSFFIGGL